MAWTAIPQFAATTGYTVGQIVRPLTAPVFLQQYAFRCTVAGTSGAEPTWSTAQNNNQTVTTGGVTFTNVTGQSTYGWSAAAGNIYCLSNAAGSARIAAGDRAFLSSDHAETNATSNSTYRFGSASYAVVQVISVNRAGSVPPVAADQTNGATITATTGSWNLDNLTSTYWQGVNFIYTGTSNIFFQSTGAKQAYFRNCSFYLNTATATSSIQGNGPVKVIWDNTTVRFGATGQAIQTTLPFQLDWINTPAAIPGAIFPTSLFTTSGNGLLLTTLRGIDLSAITGTIYTGQVGVPAYSKVLLDGCRIASGVTRYSNTFAAAASASDEVEVVSCFDGTNIISERYTPAGAVTTDKSTTMVGGAQDDVGLFSLKMVSSTRCDAWTMTLDSFWLDVENTLTGSARTATVEIISSGTLNNTDISLVVEYQGTSGSSLGSFAQTLPSALTAASALGSSAATWNNQPGTPQIQRIQATFTPQTAGRVRGYVRLGKASATVWLNPQLVIT